MEAPGDALKVVYVLTCTVTAQVVDLVALRDFAPADSPDKPVEHLNGPVCPTLSEITIGVCLMAGWNHAPVWEGLEHQRSGSFVHTAPSVNIQPSHTDLGFRANRALEVEELASLCC